VTISQPVLYSATNTRVSQHIQRSAGQGQPLQGSPDQSHHLLGSPGQGHYLSGSQGQIHDTHELPQGHNNQDSSGGRSPSQYAYPQTYSTHRPPSLGDQDLPLPPPPPDLEDLTEHQTIYSSIDNPALPFNELAGKNGEETSVLKFQNKYASPDNMSSLGPPATAKDSTISSPHATPEIKHFSLASIEADALLGVKAQLNGEDDRLASSRRAFTDTSSDISDSPFQGSPAIKSYTIKEQVPISITEEDISQVELFYRSHKTDVRVCRSLANLYVSVAKIKDRQSLAMNIAGIAESGQGTPHRKPSKQESPTEHVPPAMMPEPANVGKDEWDFCKTGIPLLILDSGDHLRDRKLSIVLAERGTGFTQWSDVINHMTKYSTPHENFHTLTLSTDSTRLVGLSFDDALAAAEFAEAVRSLTANPDDDLMKLSSKKKKKKKEKKTKYTPPKKIDISQPCCFVHVTKLEKPDYNLKLPQLVYPAPPRGGELQGSRSVDNIRGPLSSSSGLSDCSTTPSMEHLES